MSLLGISQPEIRTTLHQRANLRSHPGSHPSPCQTWPLSKVSSPVREVVIYSLRGSLPWRRRERGPKRREKGHPRLKCNSLLCFYPQSRRPHIDPAPRPPRATACNKTRQEMNWRDELGDKGRRRKSQVAGRPGAVIRRMVESGTGREEAMIGRAAPGGCHPSSLLSLCARRLIASTLSPFAPRALYHPPASTTQAGAANNRASH